MGAVSDQSHWLCLLKLLLGPYRMSACSGSHLAVGIIGALTGWPRKGLGLPREGGSGPSRDQEWGSHLFLI